MSHIYSLMEEYCKCMFKGNGQFFYGKKEGEAKVKLIKDFFPDVEKGIHLSD